MDNKGLNINRPLLSVRRFSSSITSSQKNENRKNESYVPVKKPSVDSCKTESTSNSMMNSGSVPFGWEHSPGKPKNEKNKEIQIMESPPKLQKLPPSRFFKPRKIFKAECSKSRKEESSGSRNTAGDDDNSEAYMDAVDTLSPGETSFNSCSASGVSGFGLDVKPSGLLRAEPRLRDFKLSRFLPAARAMASDAPRRTFKKIAVKENRNKVQLRYDSGKEELDDYDSDYEYHEYGAKSSKFCGLIPRFPRMKGKLPISPANRTYASSSSSSSFRETNSELARGSLYKHRSWNSVLKIESTEAANIEGSKLYNRLQGPGISAELSGSIQSTVSEQSNSSLKKKGICCFRGPGISAELGGSIQSTVSEQSNSSLKRKGICFRGPGISVDLSGSIQSTASEQSNSSSKRKGICFRGPGISVDLSGSIQSTASEQSNSSSKRKGICFRGPGISVDLSGSIQSTVSERSDSSSKKKGISFRELLAEKKNTNEITETGSQDSIIEKTVYVDTVNIAESPKDNSAPSCTKPQSSSNASLEPDMPADESKHDMKTRKCKDPGAEFEMFGDAKGSQKLKGCEPRLFQHPAPPPLPKSPSDSWLCRALPVSSKKAHTLWIPIYPSSNTVASDPKTDENDQLQSPQEQMNPMPES